MTSSITESCQPSTTSMVQNFYLVWLDKAIDKNNDKWHTFITKLHEIFNTIHTFVDLDQCIDHITDTQDTVFIIISGEFRTAFISILNELTQVNSLSIFCENQFQYDKWQKESAELPGIYMDIVSIYDALKNTVQDYDHNAFYGSFVKKSEEIADKKLNTLDSSFMYTQMLKDILLTLEFNSGHFKEFIRYCREKFANNAVELRNVQKIEKEYDGQQAIRWYTYQSFLYSMLNRALRTMEADLIVNMGFFVQDLHKHITALHTEQYGGRDHLNSFIVYRGQGLSQIDFNQLKTTEGGLLAFNNFLSTSLKREVSLKFVKHTIKQFRLIGVLFVIRIQPSLSTTPFASVRDVSYYKAEEEILFSMHSVFRIESAQQIDQNGLLWEVNLTLTDEIDPQLHALMENMRGNNERQEGWFGLASLLMKVAQFDKAKQMFEMMLNETTDASHRANIFQQLGHVMRYHESNERALSYFEKALELRQKALPANHPCLGSSYHNIGSVYSKMGEYSKALSYLEKALEILQKTLPPNHHHFAPTYNNIGLAYSNMGEYSKAVR